VLVDIEEPSPRPLSHKGRGEPARLRDRDADPRTPREAPPLPCGRGAGVRFLNINQHRAARASAPARRCPPAGWRSTPSPRRPRLSDEAVDDDLDGVLLLLVEVDLLATSRMRPSTRTRTNPARRASSKTCRCSPFRSRMIGAMIISRLPAGMARIASTICCTVCRSIGRPQWGSAACRRARTAAQ